MRRKGAVILDTVPGGSLVRMPSGEIMQEVDSAVDAETLAQMRAGYMCANCFEPCEQAFPEVCTAFKLPDGTVVGCFYRIRDRQSEDLNARYGAGDEIHVGRHTNWADEAERLREMNLFEQETGILLPDHVKFPNELLVNGRPLAIVPGGLGTSTRRRAPHILTRPR